MALCRSSGGRRCWGLLRTARPSHCQRQHRWGAGLGNTQPPRAQKHASVSDSSLGSSHRCHLCLPELQGRGQIGRPVGEVSGHAWRSRYEPYTVPECWKERALGSQRVTLRSEKHLLDRGSTSSHSVRERPVVMTCELRGNPRTHSGLSHPVLVVVWMLQSYSFGCEDTAPHSPGPEG